VQASVVNAGVLPHPVTGERVVGLVAIGGSKKLANLRANPRTAIVARAGWQWATVEGDAEIIGPDDPHPAVRVRAIAGTAGRPPQLSPSTGQQVSKDRKKLQVLCKGPT